MPIYEYRCEECTHLEESIEDIDTKEIQCPICNSKAQRIISLSSFELKGDGWYKDGYSSKSTK